MKFRHYLTAVLGVFMLGAFPAQATMIVDFALDFSGGPPDASGSVAFDLDSLDPSLSGDTTSDSWSFTVGTTSFTNSVIPGSEFSGTFASGALTKITCGSCSFTALGAGGSSDSLSFGESTTEGTIDSAVFSTTPFGGSPSHHSYVVSISSVPEPVTVALLGLGLLGLGFSKRRA